MTLKVVTPASTSVLTVALRARSANVCSSMAVLPGMSRAGMGELCDMV